MTHISNHAIVRQTLTKKLQKLFWIYLTNNFIITTASDFIMTEPAIKCGFTPVTSTNYFRVRDFRDESRIREYREKLAGKEKGFFAECDGRMVGSLWATINSAPVPTVVRTYMRLMPNEALIHDIVTGREFRGLGVGPFMVGRIASILLNEHGVSRIVIDVNVRNSPSLRMMDKAGLQMRQQVLYVSAFGKLILQKSLRQYS